MVLAIPTGVRQFLVDRVVPPVLDCYFAVGVWGFEFRDIDDLMSFWEPMIRNQIPTGFSDRDTIKFSNVLRVCFDALSQLKLSNKVNPPHVFVIVCRCYICWIWSTNR